MADSLELLRLKAKAKLKAESEMDHPASSDAPEMGAIEAAVHGLGQGAFGLGDELQGAMSSPMGALKQLGSKVGLSDASSPDVQNYRQARDEARAKASTAADQHPGAFYPGMLASGAVAGIAGGIPGAITGGIASGIGASEGEDLASDAKGGALGGAAGGVLGGAARLAGKYAPDVFSAISKRLGSAAESAAERATGATRVQAEKFAPGAGRELLDRGVVQAFDSPSSIANRAQGMMDEAGNSLNGAIERLDAKGASVGRDLIKSKIEERLQSLRMDPSKAGVVRKVEKILEDISNGPETMSLAEVENIKRGFQGQSNYAKPLSTEANKLAGSVYRDASENVANQMDPALGQQFTDAKSTYGLLKPIQEASEARATQQAQHPILGLNDIAAAGSGAAMGDPTMGLATLAARRVVAPRVSSTIAVGLDKASHVTSAAAQALQKAGMAPEVAVRMSNSPFAQLLEQAALRGQDSLASTTFLLNQSDAKFRRTYNGTEE